MSTAVRAERDFLLMAATSGFGHGRTNLVRIAFGIEPRWPSAHLAYDRSDLTYLERAYLRLPRHLRPRVEDAMEATRRYVDEREDDHWCRDVTPRQWREAAAILRRVARTADLSAPPRSRSQTRRGRDRTFSAIFDEFERRWGRDHKYCGTSCKRRHNRVWAAIYLAMSGRYTDLGQRAIEDRLPLREHMLTAARRCDERRALIERDRTEAAA